MENLNKLSRIILFICILGFVLWFGSYLLRLMLVYQLFEAKDLALKAFLNENNLPGILFVLNTAITFTFILFPVFIISLVLFLLLSRISLKKEGWLFITLLIVAITAPFEIYLMTIDYKILFDVLDYSFNASEIVELYRKRITVLSSFSLIELFSYCVIVFIFIFKPFRMKEK